MEANAGGGRMEPNQIESDIKFEELITFYSPEAQFLARQIRGIRKDVVTILREVAANKTRGQFNRALLIALIALLTGLGILNSGILAIVRL